MKLLVINGYSIFPPSGAWLFLSERGTLTALTQSGALRKISKEKPDFACLDIIAAYNKPPQEILMSAFNYIWENKEVHDV